jgi:hypothetical protein
VEPAALLHLYLHRFQACPEANRPAWRVSTCRKITAVVSMNKDLEYVRISRRRNYFAGITGWKPSAS